MYYRTHHRNVCHLIESALYFLSFPLIARERGAFHLLGVLRWQMFLVVLFCARGMTFDCYTIPLSGYLIPCKGRISTWSAFTCVYQWCLGMDVLFIADGLPIFSLASRHEEYQKATPSSHTDYGPKSYH
jgi:hypothetical protein